MISKDENSDIKRKIEKIIIKDYGEVKKWSIKCSNFNEIGHNKLQCTKVTRVQNDPMD